VQAQRELIRFLSDYQEIWHAQFPDLFRRGQWHLTCHLCLRGGRGGTPVAELAGVVKSLFLLDDATVRERVQEMQALGLCDIDPPDRTLSARTIVIPTDTLLARFDEHLLALAARLREAALAVDPSIRPRMKLTLDPAIRQAILSAVERCDQAWIAALETVFDQLNLSPARRLDARRHLMSVSHRVLLLMTLEHAAGISPHADEGEGLLADHMAALLLRLARQNFQTTRDHIGYLMQLGLLERRAGRALRVGLAAPVIAAFAPEFSRLAAALPALVGAFDSVDDVEATLTIRQKAAPVAQVPLVLVVSRVGEPTRQVPIGTEPLLVGRAGSSDVVLQSDEVSRSHCRLVPGDGGLTVIDLQSTNGTFLGGQRMTAPTVVPQGAEMKVGPYTLMCLPVVTNAPDSNKLDVEATFNRRRGAG
jgi:FHA domain